MADLFGYTPSQSIVSPASPTIQVQVNNSAANSFKALDDLFKAGMQVKTQTIQAESAILNEEMQLKRMEIADAESARVAKEKADKAAQAELELQQNLDARTQIAGAEAMYKQNLAGLRADDVEGRRKLTADYLASIDNIYNEVGPAVQKQIFDFTNGRRTAVQDEYLEFAKKHNINTFKDQMSFVMPQFLGSPAEAQQAMFGSFQDAAIRRGMTAKEFGDDFAELVGSHIVVALDQNSIAENLDYKTLGAFEESLRTLKASDPRAIKAIETAQNKIDSIRNEMNSLIKSRVTLAREAGDQVMFREHVQIGLDSGLYTEQAANAEWKKYTKSVFTPAKVAEANAATQYGRTNGRVVLADYVNKDEQKYLSGMVKEQLQAMFSTGQYDADLLRFHAQNNPNEFKTAFNSNFERIYNIARSAAMQQQNAKTPEEKQAATVQFLQVVDLMDRHSAQSNGIMDTDQLIKSSVIKAVALSGSVVNIADAYNNIEDAGGVALLDDNNVGKIYDDLPKDMQHEGHRIYSGLVAAGLDRDLAFEAVTNTYKFEELDNVSFGVSGNVMKLLNNADVGTDSLKMLEKVLLNDGSLAGLPEETFAPEVREAIAGVTGGTNPTVRLYKGHLYFENEEGSTAMVRFGQAEVATLTDAMNTAWRASEEAQPSVGIPRIAEDAAQSLSITVSKEFQGISDAAELVGATGEFVADSIIPSWEDVTTLMSSELSNANQFIDDLYSGMSLAEAQAATLARQEKSFKEYQKAIGGATSESGKRLGEAWDQVKADWNATVDNAIDLNRASGEYLMNFIPSTAGALRKLLISEAEGNVSPADAYWVQPNKSLAGSDQFSKQIFDTYIARRAESRHGYDKKTGTYTPVKTHDAAEKDTPKPSRSSDIGYGHKITIEEWKSGQIYGNTFIDPKTNKIVPLTEAQVLDIMQQDMANNLSVALPNWNKKISSRYTGFDFSDVGEAQQAVLTSLAYNVGGSKARQWEDIFDNDGLYASVMVPDEVAKFANDLRRNDGGKKTAGMDNRVMKELVAAGLIYDEYTFKMVQDSLPLMNEYPDYDSTLK